jgi:hypothetical protein
MDRQLGKKPQHDEDHEDVEIMKHHAKKAHH